MAMLLDSSPSSIEDLSAWDTELLKVAAAEDIDLTAKLQLATAQVVRKLQMMLQPAIPLQGLVGSESPLPRHIAVTIGLKLWHTYMALRLVYQDLYYSRQNDRYQAKMKLYAAQEDYALDELRIQGIGVVFDPIAQALAPQIAIVQSPDPGGRIYVGVSLINRRGEEGMMSVPLAVDTQDQQAASVSLLALADNAVGWNLYAGLAPDAMARQNREMLDPLASVVLAPGRLAAGCQPGDGQQPDHFYPLPRKVLRG